MKNLVFIALIAVLAFALVGCSDNSPFDVNGKTTNAKEANNAVKNNDRVGEVDHQYVYGYVYPENRSPGVYVWIVGYEEGHNTYTGSAYWQADNYYSMICEDIETTVYNYALDWPLYGGGSTTYYPPNENIRFQRDITMNYIGK